MSTRRGPAGSGIHDADDCTFGDDPLARPADHDDDARDDPVDTVDDDGAGCRAA
ncbi:MAG: hypothetical protein RIS35_755, partial [Pseudomonadota bacterium]